MAGTIMFGTLEFCNLGSKILISGPKAHLSALKKFLASHGIRSAPHKERWAQTVQLAIEPDGNPQRVQRLLDEWTV